MPAQSLVAKRQCWKERTETIERCRTETIESVTSAGSDTSDTSSGDLIGVAYTCPETKLLMQDDHTGPTIIGTTRPLPRAGLADRTVFIFDWDDTLFPTSWIVHENLRPGRACQPTAEQKAGLDALAVVVEATLKLALTMGEVMIITNAETGWVELSCKTLFPGLFPLVEQMRVVCAREVCANSAALDPVFWKVRAFAVEAANFCAAGVSNVISIGDSINERIAVLTSVAKQLPCLVKSVKLAERPTLLCMKRTQGVLLDAMTTICSHNGDLDLSVYVDMAVSSLITYGD